MTRYRDAHLAAHGSPGSAGVRPEATRHHHTYMGSGQEKKAVMEIREDLTLLHYSQSVPPSRALLTNHYQDQQCCSLPEIDRFIFSLHIIMIQHVC